MYILYPGSACSSATTRSAAGTLRFLAYINRLARRLASVEATARKKTKGGREDEKRERDRKRGRRKERREEIVEEGGGSCEPSIQRGALS